MSQKHPKFIFVVAFVAVSIALFGSLSNMFIDILYRLEIAYDEFKQTEVEKMRALTVPHLVARLREGLMMHGWVLTLEGIEIPLFYIKNIESI